MQKRTIPDKKNKSTKRKPTPVLPTLIAVGSACGLAATPANALELGEVQVDSSLGQPLRASIAYALNPNEQLFDYCIYLRPAAADSGIPTVTRAQISVANNRIFFTGRTGVREPLLSMHVAVDCPYTPHLRREYSLMIDPAVPAAAPNRSASTIPATPLPARSTQPTPTAVRIPPPPAKVDTPPRTVRIIADSSPVPTKSRYVVQQGDTLSTIVSRIEDRNLTLWPAVDAIFAANPHAFIDNDVNRLMAGSILDIPALNAVADFDVTDESSSPNISQSEPNSASVEAPPAETSDKAQMTAEDGKVAGYSFVVLNEAEAPAGQEDIGESIPASETSGDLRPGDIVTVSGDTATTEIVIPPTVLDNGPATDIAPIVTVTETESPKSTGGLSWLVWLGGTGLALIVGLLFFGRTIRERFGPAAAGVPPTASRRHDDDPTQKNLIIEDVDLSFEDAVNGQSISLDADLGAGTGLQDNADIDVAQDFGFSASGQVENQMDIEFTEEAASDDESSPTDVIPPNHRVGDESIIAREISPEEAEGADYDFSMIVDATRQPIGEYDATAKDLNAIQVTTIEDEYTVSNDTLSSDIDYKILEQDYEDELTATQALNLEIVRAAEELADSMDQDDTSDMKQDALDLAPTAEMPIRKPVNESSSEMEQSIGSAADAGAESTLEMPPVSNTDLTAEIAANISTEFDAENDEDAAGDTEEITIEMAASGSDVTVEMQVESGSIDTKKNKLS